MFEKNDKKDDGKQNAHGEKVNPEVEELVLDRKSVYEEIWTESAAKVARKYDINYGNFLSTCRENAIPVPPSGYWTKVEMGRPAERTPLPESEISNVTFITGVPEKRRKTQKEEKPIEAHPAAKRPEEPKLPKVEEGSTEISDTSFPEDDKVPLEVYIKSPSATGINNRDILYAEVWENPPSVVAKKYGTTDWSIRSMCKRMDVPLPDRGYWAKVKAGKPVEKAPLPKIKKVADENKPKTGSSRKLQIPENSLEFMKEDGRNTIIAVAEKLRVAGPGSKLHKNVIAYKAECEEWYDLHSKGINMRYGSKIEPPTMAAEISKASYPRAFHIIDAVLKAVLPYNGALLSDYQHIYRFRINSETVDFQITESKLEIPHEITKQEKMELLKYEEAKRKSQYARKPNVPKYDHPWSGKLCLSVGNYKFRDCKAYELEDRIGEILIAFYEASYPVRLKRLEEEEKNRKEREEYERKERIRERYNDEVDRVRALVNAAEDYDISRKIRAYVQSFEDRTDTGKGLTKEQLEWITWAELKADWFDPSVVREDEFLGKRKHSADPENKKLEHKYRW